jgi:hypothetical protein
MELIISLDLGSDTLKVAYAFSYLGKDFYGKITPESYDGFTSNPFPAVAFYHDVDKKWFFADEVDSVRSNSYFNTVKIKSLLSLLSDFGDGKVNTKNREFYSKTDHFPKFNFPLRRIVLNNYQKMIDDNLTFQAKGYTPKTICSLYFDYVYNVVMKRISALKKEFKIKDEIEIVLAIVYPSKSNKEYIDELRRLIETSFKQKAKTVQSSSKCLCQFAAYLNMIKFGEKILLFDMGEEDISVSKASLVKGKGNSLGIAIDGQSGHNEPIEIGGNDVDEAIAFKLEERIRGREIPGTPSYGELGHIEEKGLNAKQYLFVKNIKMAKTYFSRMSYEPYLEEIYREGVPIDIHREVYIETVINKNDVMQWVGIDKNTGICKQILDYINDEARRPVNEDVTKIMLCGGLAETIGLEEVVRRKVSRSIEVVCFDYASSVKDPFSVQKHEDSIYAASVGGAIIALKNYKIQMVLTLSYGTFLSSGGVRFLRLFVDKATPIPPEGDTFSLTSSIYGQYVDQEILSTHFTADKIARSNFSLTTGKELFIYEPGTLARREIAKKVGLEVISGASKDNLMKIYFYVKYRGKLEKVTIGSSTPIKYMEGIRIDSDGRIVPFIKTVTYSDRNDLIKIYQRQGYSLIAASNAADEIIRYNDSTIDLYVNYQLVRCYKRDIIIGYDKVVEFSDNQADNYGE